ncbi:MAG: tetratricopeptide repeat protein [Planctomycetota bacterium]|jgi:tetratricopeptide (TPR) repeat protein
MKIFKYFSLVFMLSLFISSAAFTAGNYTDLPFYATERAKAEKLMRQRKSKEALEIFIKLSEARYTDFQKDDALEQAIEICLKKRDYKQAELLAGKITDKNLQDLLKIKTLSYQRKWKDIIIISGKLDFNKWPQSLRARAYAQRGKAYYNLKNGEKAVSDYRQALICPMKSEFKGDLYYQTGEIYRNVLNDTDKAIEYYKKMHGAGRVDYSRQLQCILATARTLKSSKKYEEALNELTRKKPPKGYWGLQFMSLKADILLDQEKIEEALKIYQKIVEDKSVADKYKEKYKNIIVQMETMLAAQKENDDEAENKVK